MIVMRKPWNYSLGLHSVKYIQLYEYAFQPSDKGKLLKTMILILLQFILL